MATGLWTAVSGAIAQQERVDQVANNLANSDTPGFKKDEITFKEYLSTLEQIPDPQEPKRGPIKDKDLYPLDGKDQSFVVTDGTYTSFKPGHLRVTQSPLDLALDGKGFLEVSTPAGVRFTKYGSLRLNSEGTLVTTEGHPILSSRTNLPAQAEQGTGLPDDPAIAARMINLRDQSGKLSITEKGEIYSGDRLITHLSVVEFEDLNALRKRGNQLFENSNPENLSNQPAQTIVRQGMIETSNVSPVEEMTNLIRANRMFEYDLKAIKTYNDMMGREVNDIGKL